MQHSAFTHRALLTPPRPTDAGSRPSPSRTRLAGWQIPVKDSVDVAGWPTTNGNPARAYIAASSDPVVHMILGAGATIPGKTLTSELGATCYAERPGVPVLESPAFPGCTPGGSSTGAAVAVAEGQVRAAHGTDAGGSLRVPAAACDIVGFKPASPHVAAHGFLTRTVADQCALYGMRPAAPRRLRIGLLLDALLVPSSVSTQRADAIEELAGRLARHHDVVRLRPYEQCAETFTHFSRRITRSFTSIDPRDSAYLQWLAEEGAHVTHEHMRAVHAHVRALPHLLAAQWDVDVVLSPTLAYDPPPLGYFSSLTPAESFYEQTVWSPWCSVFNVTGSAAISVGNAHIGVLGNATRPAINATELLNLAWQIEALLGMVA